MAASYNNIGLVYDSQGKYEEALEMQTKSLDIRTRIYGGNNHQDVAGSYQNLSAVYQRQGNQVQAKKMVTYGVPNIPEDARTSSHTNTVP